MRDLLDVGIHIERLPVSPEALALVCRWAVTDCLQDH